MAGKSPTGNRFLPDEARFCGVDPGLKGALAVIDGIGNILDLRKMPVRKDGLIDHEELSRFLGKHPGAHVYLERALAFGMGTTSAFNYGRGFAAVEIAIEQAGLRINYVYPAVWTRLLHKDYPGGNSPKERSLQAAGDLFGGDALPRLRSGRVHDGVVDALLIAEYGRRQAMVH